MAQAKRRDWLHEDDTQLMKLWPAIGSVALIGIMMERSRSSVQTRASRLNLPSRTEESDRHRRRWSEPEDAKLDAALVEVALPDGGIPIQQVADRLERSVDAVVARIEARYGEHSDICARLVAPPMPTLQPTLARVAGAPRKSRRSGGEWDCLRCRRPFWSEGVHNWVCDRCKRTDDWD